MKASGSDSGLIEFIVDNLEKVPDEPGVYMIVASSQKVLFVDQTGDKNLRESLWEVQEEQPFGALEYFRYFVEPDNAAAEALKTRLIQEHKPPHNLGYTRFRNEEVKVPRQGHSIRHAAPNP